MITRSFMNEGVDDAPQRLDEAVHHASVDAEYRQRLMERPIDTLREAGIELPDGVRVHVHEFDPSERHIFLPPLADPRASRSPRALNTAAAAPSRPPGSPTVPATQTAHYAFARPFARVQVSERSSDNG